MKLDYFKVFYGVANNKSFSKTARELHLAQSTVSLQIKQLEEYWDCQLFDRTRKNIKLTDAGTILYNQIDKFHTLINETGNALQQLKGIIHGNLKIGASLTIGEYLLPYTITEFHKLYPQVNLSIEINNSKEVMRKLENREIHVGLIESSLPYHAFEQIPFAEDELIIVCSPDQVSAISQNITIDEFISLPFIMREKGSGTRQVIEDSLRKKNIDPDQLHVIMEFEHIESIKSAVEAGLGISILSKSTVKKELKLNMLHQLNSNELFFNRNFYIVYDEELLQQPSRKLIEHMTADMYLPLTAGE